MLVDAMYCSGFQHSHVVHTGIRSMNVYHGLRQVLCAAFYDYRVSGRDDTREIRESNESK